MTAPSLGKISIFNDSEWLRVFNEEIERNENQASSDCTRDAMISGASAASSAALFTFSSTATWPLYLSFVTAGLFLLGYSVYLFLHSGETYRDNVKCLRAYQSKVTHPSFQTFVTTEGLGNRFTFEQILNVCRYLDQSAMFTPQERELRKAALKASF